MKAVIFHSGELKLQVFSSFESFETLHNSNEDQLPGVEMKRREFSTIQCFIYSCCIMGLAPWNILAPILP